MIHRIDGTLLPETMEDCRNIRDHSQSINNSCEKCSLNVFLPRININSEITFFSDGNGCTTHYDCTLYMAFVGIEQNYDHALNQKKYLLGE